MQLDPDNLSSSRQQVTSAPPRPLRKLARSSRPMPEPTTRPVGPSAIAIVADREPNAPALAAGSNPFVPQWSAVCVLRDIAEQAASDIAPAGPATPPSARRSFADRESGARCRPRVGVPSSVLPRVAVHVFAERRALFAAQPCTTTPQRNRSCESWQPARPG